MPHYFDRDSMLESHPFDVKFSLESKSFLLHSDLGVFSKDALDTGTEGLLLEILSHAPIQGRLLDLGCGIGTLGLVLASFFPLTEVHLTDVSSRAIQLATQNAKRLKIEEAHIYYSDVYDSINETFEAIVCNPPIRAGKAVVHRMLTESFDHLCQNGVLWVVIRKSHGAESARKRMLETFGNCEIMRRHHGHYVLLSKKQSKLVDF
jgi:16S rRNA (guanine1207-N2)-methyltransferase